MNAERKYWFRAKSYGWVGAFLIVGKGGWSWAPLPH
jgi:hypothetical protein